MQLTDCHPVIVDVFKREAIYAVLKSIGVPELDRPRWVIARRLIEPVLVADGEEAARHILEDYYLPADVLDLEIPEIENIREVELHGAKHIACTILGQQYTAYLPPEAEQKYEDWGHAASN
jgi:hypothetical protein